jgi:hypothetical protein
VPVSYTTETFVEHVRRRANMPDAGSPTDQEILDVANAELATRFVPFLRETAEGYGLKTTTRTLTVGTADYRIPADAQGDAIHSLVLVKSDGTERNLRRLTIQDDEEWSTNGAVRGYCLIGSKIRLLPAPDAADTLRIVYYRRLSSLVPRSSCGEILSISGTDFVLDYSDYVATQDRSGESFDLVQHEPPFDLVFDDTAATISATATAIDITFAAGLAIMIDVGSGWSPTVGDSISQGTVFVEVTFVTSPTIFTVSETGLLVGAASAYEITGSFGGASLSDASEGDFVCDHMTTCIPPIPAELHPALVSATAAQLLVEDGDAQGAAMETANAQRIMDAARATLSPRADGSPRFLIPRNSPTRSRLRRQPGWDVSR